MVIYDPDPVPTTLRPTVGASGAGVWRRCHRASATILGAFILLHLSNHVAGLAGQDVHRTVQLWLRIVYQGWMEPILLLACAVQAGTGLRMAWVNRRARGRARVQVLSGLYLAVFLTIHVGVVLTARRDGIETDLAFAAAGMHAGWWFLFFAPYYGLAVLALGLHLSIPVGRRHPRGARVLVLVSALVSVAHVLLLAGVITPLTIPAVLTAAFGG